MTSTVRDRQTALEDHWKHARQLAQESGMNALIQRDRATGDLQATIYSFRSDRWTPLFEVDKFGRSIPVYPVP